MPSIRTWQRLEARARSGDPAKGLQARVHDPLWMLARQWQWGEFRGAHGGSPVATRLEGEAASLTRFGLGDDPKGGDYDPARLPLEVLAEREPAPSGPGAARSAAEAGLQWTRLLWQGGVGDATRAAVRENFPLRRAPDDADAESARFLHVMVGRVPDGHGLYNALRTAYEQDDLPALMDRLGVPGEDRTAFNGAVPDWLKWYNARYSEPEDDEDAWVPERLEYRLSVAASTLDGGETVLSARTYRGGHLDWHAFSVDDSRTLGTPRPAAPRAAARTLLPVPVSFSGMPHPRWWTFEDARVDLGDLDTAPEDLSRMIFAEFALRFGNDWFVVPVDLPVGTIFHMDRLRVMDTFGDEVPVDAVSRPNHPAHPHLRWRLFELSGTPASAPPPLLLTPSLPASTLRGAPVETVRFIRDEAANYAWAIERVAPSPLTGRPIDRYELYQQRQGAAEEPDGRLRTAADVTYRLATDVPGYWIPLVPRRQGARGMYLEPGRLFNTQTGHTGEVYGRILKPMTFLFEEEVPRAGTVVTRSCQYARWADGSSHLWIGRRRRPGRGEGSSGLRYDVVESVTRRDEPLKGTPQARISLRTLLRYTPETDAATLQHLRARVRHEATAADVNVHEAPETVTEIVKLMARYLHREQ